MDSDRKHKDEKSLVAAYERDELTERLKAAGGFVLVSSYMIATEDILGVYYTRQGRSSTSRQRIYGLSRLRVYLEEAARGMMVRTFIASSLIRHMQIRLKGMSVPFRMAMLSLRNQKCRVYDDVIIVDEPNKKVPTVYRSCGIHCPIRLGTTRSGRKS